MHKPHSPLSLTEQVTRLINPALAASQERLRTFLASMRKPLDREAARNVLDQTRQFGASALGAIRSRREIARSPGHKPHHNRNRDRGRSHGPKSKRPAL